MCSTESCFGYLLLAVILFFSLFIFILLKIRKNILSNDLKLSAKQLWNEFTLSFPQNVFCQNDLMFSIWQDKSSTMSILLVKNDLDVVIGRVEFPIGAREYKVFIADQVYKIVVNLTWGGTRLTLFSPDDKELARLERKSVSPMRHKIIIPGLGTLKSKQPILNLKAPIVYSLNENQAAYTRFMSPVRRIGRMGYFSKEISLPIKIFILSMTS